MKVFVKAFIGFLMLLSSYGVLMGQNAPRIFFSDLESGPNTGGQNNNGVFVTIWGKGFGVARGGSRVMIGGGAADNYPVWTDGKITFQLGARARSGDIVVKVAGAEPSNGVPFNVRPGRVFFVATNGRDRNSGSFLAPWKTLVRAKNSMSPGDTTYIEDGVTQTSEDRFTAYLSMDRGGANNSGTGAAPKALVAYPGAKAGIGVARGLPYGLRTPNIAARADYWVLSQLHLVGGSQALDVSGVGWKIVGNDIECPGADGHVGCVEMSGSSQIKFYGNEVHNAGMVPRSSKFYHAVYFSTDSNHIDVGWNHIHDNATCRAIQFHSSPLCSPACGERDRTGFNQYDLHVHDNLIHGDNCNGINFATVDPSQGTVEAYNNVIYHVGLQDPLQQGGAFSCIYVAGISYHGKGGAGAVEAFNNTLYDCGGNNSRNAQGARGAFGTGGGTVQLRLRNNIVYQLPGEIYIDGPREQITGDRNLWFGAGSPPRQTANNLGADPVFVDRNRFDFHLSASSPARDAGLTVRPNNPFLANSGAKRVSDKDGVSRPQEKAFALGAYELPAAAVAGKTGGP